MEGTTMEFGRVEFQSFVCTSLSQNEREREREKREFWF